MKKDYIIDFERVNQLTTSVYDDPDDKLSPISDGKFAYSVSRRSIREYLDIFTSWNPSVSNSDMIKDKVKHVIDTLEYNGILIHKSTIRDNKINEILEI